jgi:hypothetical protein
MLIIQNEFSPAGIQNGLFDLMREGVASIRIRSAYMSMSGSALPSREGSAPQARVRVFIN